MTLVVENPGGRFPHLCGDAPDRIGVRVPLLEPGVAALADAVGGLLITSANLRGEPAPARLEDVPAELTGRAAVVVDGGELPGAASSVIDVTGDEPVVLRDGPGVDARARSAGHRTIAVMTPSLDDLLAEARSRYRQLEPAEALRAMERGAV